MYSLDVEKQECGAKGSMHSELAEEKPDHLTCEWLAANGGR